MDACVIHYVYLLFVSVARVPGLGTLWVCHPVCHASAESVPAELLWDVSDCHETSAQQQASCVLPKIHLFSSLFLKETAVYFLNLCKNLKSHLKYLGATFYSRCRNGQ